VKEEQRKHALIGSRPAIILIEGGRKGERIREFTIISNSLGTKRRNEMI
jgi:hypothetical protein